MLTKATAWYCTYHIKDHSCQTWYGIIKQKIVQGDFSSGIGITLSAAMMDVN